LGATGLPTHELVVNWRPCVQCYGATLWSGVRGLVVAGEGPELEEITTFDEGPLGADWAEQFEARGIEVVGDVLRDEALTVFRDYRKAVDEADGIVVYNARGGAAVTPRFATDVVTFYHPDFWGLESADAVRDWALANPERLLGRVMDALAEAGVTGIELTFAPGDIESALRAFGSAPGFRRELVARGLSVVSAFVAGSDSPDWRDADNLPAIVADAERRAAFLADVGAELLVAGCPCARRSGPGRPSSSTPRT
jgi:hypothetical protein